MMYFNFGHNDIDYEHKIRHDEQDAVVYAEQSRRGSTHHRRLALVGERGETGAAALEAVFAAASGAIGRICALGAQAAHLAARC